MSRTYADNAGLTAIENAVLKPFWTTLTMQDDTLHFDLNTSIGNLTQDTDICTSLFQASATAGKVAGMDTSGVLYITETNFAGNSLGISSANTSRVRVSSSGGVPTCMHGTFDSSGTYYWMEGSFGSSWNLYSGTLSGTTLTRSNLGSLTGVFAMQNNSTYVRRVESVCHTLNGIVIVVGNYDFTRGAATIQFYLYNSTFYPTGVKQLETIIQFNFTETYTNWYSVNKSGSFSHATTDPGSTNRLVIIGNDGRRAMKFNVRYAAESALEPVIPIDYDLGGDLPQHKFIPTGIMRSAGVLHLSGRYTRPFTDNTSVVVEMYAVSKDGVLWSVGEYSSFITSLPTYQVLPVLSSSYTSPTIIYSVGSLVSYDAPARVIDGNGSATDITNYVNEGTVEMASNSADQMNLSFLTNPSNLNAGMRIDLSMGLTNSSGVQKGGAYGRYVAMTKPLNTTVYGQAPGEVAALDEASWRLSTWNSPVDVDRWSSTIIPDQFSTNPTFETTLVLKTPLRGITYATTGFSSVALNDPFVGYSTTRDERDGLTSVRARFTSTDAYSQQSVGLIFGATESQFNAFIIPRPSTWLETTSAPFVATSNLNGESWELEEQQTGIWKSVLTDPFAKLMKHPNASASANDIYWYGTSASTFVTANEDYRFTLRTQGRRVQLYGRKMRTAYNEFASYADEVPLAEYRFGTWARKKFDDRQYFGAMCGTDVPGSKDWWRQAQYGDMSLSLTKTSDLYTPSTMNTDFNELIGSGTFTAGGGGSGTVSGVSLTSGKVSRMGGTLPQNYFIRLNGTGINAIFQVASKTDGTMNSSFVASLVNGTSSGSATVNIYVFTASDRWGWASSTSDSEADTSGVLSLYNPGAVKRNELAWGRGIFISDDNSAVSPRYAVTDGVTTDILSPGNAGVAWDSPTNPVEGFGSQPTEWRWMMNHGMFFEGDPSQYGLPSSGYNAFRVQDEIVRGIKQTYTKAGFQSTFTGCYIPTYYRPLAAASRNSSTLAGWRSGSNRPGDRFEDVKTAMGTNFAGMLVEIVSNNVSETEEPTQYYAVDGTFSGSDDYLTLDKPYPGDLLNLEAVAVLSGRGWGNTLKVTHPADSPAVYCPLEAADIAALRAPADYIRMDAFKGCLGLYNSAEDDIKYVAAMAGVRNVAFGSKYSATTTPSTTGTSLSASESNFVLELNAHLYSDGTTLKVGIRDYLTLHLSSRTDITGQSAVLALGLEAYNSGISASGGVKWLSKPSIPISDFFPFGVLNSSGARTEDTSVKNNIRIIVVNNLIRVEFEGMLAWCFDLKDFDYVSSGGSVVSHYSQGYGAVTVKYSAASALSVTMRLQELSEEVENHIVDIASAGDEAISFVTSERHILMRSDQTGGIEFSRYLTRPSVETISENVVSVNQTDSNMDPTGHMQVSGSEYGEYIDQAWIQANGYRFGSSSNRLLNTVSDSVTEARLIQRLSKENSAQYSMAVSGIKYKWQPEDGIVWDGKSLVISAASVGFGKDYRSSQYNLRLNYG